MSILTHALCIIGGFVGGVMVMALVEVGGGDE